MKQAYHSMAGLITLALLCSCSTINQQPEETMTSTPTQCLPDYVVINKDDCPEDKKNMLRVPSAEITFPLSDQVQQMINQLEAKFDQEKMAVGLAAPQLGFPLKAIIFKVDNSAAAKRWRPDLIEGMPRTIWLNPSYQAIGNEKHGDYESCFSVDDVACEIKRYQYIKYIAYDLNGNKITGEAKGFLARVIQHEIDHINGMLCIDSAVPGTIMDKQAYINMRQAAETGKISRTVEGNYTKTHDITEHADHIYD